METSYTNNHYEQITKIRSFKQFYKKAFDSESNCFRNVIKLI